MVLLGWSPVPLNQKFHREHPLVPIEGMSLISTMWAVPVAHVGGGGKSCARQVHVTYGSCGHHGQVMWAPPAGHMPLRSRAFPVT